MKMPRKLLQFDPTQPRKSFIEDELDRLGDDQVKHGTLVPLLIGKPDPATGISIIYDGERRVRAGDKKGIQEYPVTVIDKPLTDKEKLGIQLRTVIHRADLTPYDKWAAVAQLVASGGMQQQEVAKFLNITAGQVCRILSPSKTIPEAQQALKDGRISLSDAYALSKLSAEDQPTLLALKLSGASRDDLERAGKRKRNGADKNGKPPDRSERVTIPVSVVIKETTEDEAVKEIPVRGSVTVAGPAKGKIDFLEAERLLKEALRSVREAQNKGWGVKAAQAAWRDVAQQGEKKRAKAQEGGGNGQSAPGQ